MEIAKVKRVAKTTVTSVSKESGTYIHTRPLRCLEQGTIVHQLIFPWMPSDWIIWKKAWLIWTWYHGTGHGNVRYSPQMPNTSDLEAPFNTTCQQLCQLDATRHPTSGEVLKMLKDITVPLSIDELLVMDAWTIWTRTELYHTRCYLVLICIMIIWMKNFHKSNVTIIIINV